MTYFKKINSLEEASKDSKVINGEFFIIPSNITCSKENLEASYTSEAAARRFFKKDLKEGDKAKRIWTCSYAKPRSGDDGKGGILINHDECSSSWNNHGVPEELYIFEKEWSLGPWNKKENRPYHSGGLFPEVIPLELIQDMRDGETLYLSHIKEDENKEYVFALKANQKGGRYSGFSFEELL